MNYTVHYLPNAEQELAALWMDSSKRAAVTRAVHQIDLRLQQTPAELGESRPSDCRIYFEAPLAVLFRVLVGRQRVEVIHIWEFN